MPPIVAPFRRSGAALDTNMEALLLREENASLRETLWRLREDSKHVADVRPARASEEARGWQRASLREEQPLAFGAPYWVGPPVPLPTFAPPPYARDPWAAYGAASMWPHAFPPGVMADDVPTRFSSSKDRDREKDREEKEKQAQRDEQVQRDRQREEQQERDRRAREEEEQRQRSEAISREKRELERERAELERHCQGVRQQLEAEKVALSAEMRRLVQESREASLQNQALQRQLEEVHQRTERQQQVHQQQLQQLQLQQQLLLQHQQQVQQLQQQPRQPSPTPPLPNRAPSPTPPQPPAEQMLRLGRMTNVITDGHRYATERRESVEPASQRASRATPIHVSTEVPPQRAPTPQPQQRSGLPTPPVLAPVSGTQPERAPSPTSSEPPPPVQSGRPKRSRRRIAEAEPPVPGRRRRRKGKERAPEQEHQRPQAEEEGVEEVGPAGAASDSAPDAAEPLPLSRPSTVRNDGTDGAGPSGEPMDLADYRLGDGDDGAPRYQHTWKRRLDTLAHHGVAEALASAPLMPRAALLPDAVQPTEAEAALYQQMVRGIRVAALKGQQMLPCDATTDLSTVLSDGDFDRTRCASEYLPCATGAPGVAGRELRAKHYCPRVFEAIRLSHGVTCEDYCRSWDYGPHRFEVTASAGKSGALFFTSLDGRYLCKTISHDEALLFLKILKDYYAHLRTSPRTMVMRVFGLHRFAEYAPLGQRWYILVLGCVHHAPLPGLLPSHVYDLKGREPKPGKFGRRVEQGGTLVQRDNDIDRKFYLPRATRDCVLTQLETDIAFLRKHNLMGYSLLVSVCPLTPSDVSSLLPQHPTTPRTSTPSGSAFNTPSRAARRLSLDNSGGGGLGPVDEALPVLPASVGSPVPAATHGVGAPPLLPPARLMMGSAHTNAPFWEVTEAAEAEGSIINAWPWTGGLLLLGRSEPHGAPELYSIGLIDCLTEYTLGKVAAHGVKAMFWTSQQLSTVPADQFGQRLLEYSRRMLDICVPLVPHAPPPGAGAGATIAAARRRSVTPRGMNGGAWFSAPPSPQKSGDEAPPEGHHTAQRSHSQRSSRREQ